MDTLIRNYLVVPLLTKVVLQYDTFIVDFGEFLEVIEGYISGLPFTKRLLIENDSSLLSIVLPTISDDISNLGVLAFIILNMIDKNFYFIISCKKERQYS